MEEFTIHPIKTGEFLAAEKSNFTYQQGCGEKFVSPIIMYCIKGRDKVILVDTGGSDEAWAAIHHHGLRRTPDMHPLEGLRKIGVEAKDVEIIVNTHLHWDHCFNNELFPNARIYVQKREMEYAVHPLPVHCVYYESHQVGLTPRWMRAYHRITVVEGDHDLIPGVKLVTLPGHTPGFQGVLVNTSRGRGLVASDCQALFENWEGNAQYDHIPSGIHYSLEDYFATFKKMEKICDFILPGHDPKVFDQEVYP
ncbi:MULTISPECIES: N-acyl homoserine lactonase family protein [unclassified Desulfovibrio]|uniref:N-acyl homoserine lactonase family protein n=1 Tax=unclassified Desulfovibrio TaxID=2593640 RepID=UPI000F5E5660|nr:MULTISPECIES: N-acyl homoserine lactonase family protein [unclassified Desulfovibrio]RRD69317.1 N-acyl homoserine lactonase family protein [Desulfovibrio sp. OH1209_COT-279]RRD86032.1 N-acyl homoserine lactonase family protein [Desulfovibrio sp. OH1186_COT-070]